MLGEHLGCHVGHVEGPEQFSLALERASNSGKIAVINVVVSPMDYKPGVATVPAAYRRWFGIERMSGILPSDGFEYMDKEWKDMGVAAFIGFVIDQTSIFGI